MQINYLGAVSSVLNMMKQPDRACINIDMHRTCYTTSFKHLVDHRGTQPPVPESNKDKKRIPK